MDALTSLYDEVSIGRIVILDDYATDFVQCREAVDQFFVQRGIRDPLIRVDRTCYW